MDDLVQQVYLGGIEAGKRLIASYAQYSPSDVKSAPLLHLLKLFIKINAILELMLPILLRRSQEDVHNLRAQSRGKVKIYRIFRGY